MANSADVRMAPRRRVILIVEDDPLVRMDAAQSLRDAGFGVHEAPDFQKAIGFLQSGSQIDLIFTHINLGGGKNGVELASWGLANAPGLKVLLTTGERLQVAVPPSLGEILAKPYTVGELLRRVNDALGEAPRSAAPHRGPGY